MLKIVPEKSLLPFVEDFNLLSTKDVSQASLLMRRNAMESYTKRLLLKSGQKWQTFLKGTVLASPVDSIDLNWGQYALPESEANTVVFVNGHYDSELSSCKPEDIQITPVPVIEHIMKMETPFADLNQAYAVNPQNITISQSSKLRLIFISVGDGQLSLPSVHLTISKGLSVALEEVHITEGKSLLGSLIVGDVKESVSLKHSVFLFGSGRPILSHAVSVGKNSEYVFDLFKADVSSFVLDQAISLYENVTLEIKSALRSYETVDWFNSVSHLGDHSHSTLKVRTVGKEDSFATVLANATIPAALKDCSIDQDLKGLFLEEGAAFNLTPNMMVSTEEAVAHHGAAMETVSKDKLFYLQSRGLSVKDSESILIDAFCTL